MHLKVAADLRAARKQGLRLNTKSNIAAFSPSVAADLRAARKRWLRLDTKSDTAAFSPSLENRTYGLHGLEQTVIDKRMLEVLRAAGAAPLVQQRHVCVQEHDVVADQGVEAAKTPNGKDSCVDAKDCISAVAVAPPSKHAGPRSTLLRRKRVLSAPVESESRNLGNGDAPSDSGFRPCRPARKSWAIQLAETVLIILAQAICSGRTCPNATLHSLLNLHHPIQEGKAEGRESKNAPAQTKAVVGEHALGISNPVEPKVARTGRKREKRRASRAVSQRLKKDNARPRWVGGSWGTALAAERKLAILDAFYRQKRGVETRTTAREHGKCCKTATSTANASPTTNAVAWKCRFFSLLLVAAAMLFATMSTGRTPLFTGLMISQQAFVSPPTPLQTASHGPRRNSSSVTVKGSRALVPTGSVAPQARSARSSRVTEPGVVAPPGSSAGRVVMSGVVAVLCIVAAYVAQGGRRDGFSGSSGGEGTTSHRRGKGKAMGSPLRLHFSSKHVSKLLLLVALLSSAHAARPWSVTYGGCVFSGDLDGAPLVRSGSCPTAALGVLSLSNKGITSVKDDSFVGMGACT